MYTAFQQGGCKMAGKSGKAPEMGTPQRAGLGGTILRMLAVGVIGGIALIGGAKKVGDAIIGEDEKSDELDNKEGTEIETEAEDKN
jgi:hypothetical protein